MLQSMGGNEPARRGPGEASSAAAATHDGAGPVPAVIPSDEENRLADLRRTGLLDSAADAAFEAVTQAAVALFDVPTSLITLVDRDRQWFKSRCGFAQSQTSRDVSFCAHAILHDGVMVVPDATRDERFAANPQVLEDPHIRFYAGAPLKTPSGAAIGTLCVIDERPRTDFGPAEQVLLEQLAAVVQGLIDAATRLKAADETRSLFLSTVSHDLRGRVAAISGYADLLQRHSSRLDASKREAFIAQIGSSAIQLSALLDDILDLERASLGELRADAVPADLGALVRRVVEGQGIAMRHPADLDLPEVVVPVDVQLMERAVENLVGNADKHTPEGTRVFIRVQPSAGGAEIVVEDEGQGVDAADREAIFEAFQRRGDAAARPSGSGLGLYLVRRFVELHGGRVWVQEGAGGGASFRIWLPGEANA